MTIVAEKNIWFPGIYAGRIHDAVYHQKVADILLVDLVELVQKRAKEDGEWAIENGFVGDNEDKMRKMMAWVSNPVNIEQCVGHILKAGNESVVTIDWVCRDLAIASKVIGGSSD